MSAVIAGTVVAAALGLCYVYFRAALRQLALERKFPALRNPVARETALIADPFMAAESAPPDGEDYARVLQRLVDEHRTFAEQERILADSRAGLSAASTAAGRYGLAVTKLQTAWFFRKTRLARARLRLRVAEDYLEAVEQQRVRVDQSAASIRVTEDAVKVAREEWVRKRPPRQDAGDRQAWIERNTLLVMFFDIAKPKHIAWFLERHKLEVVSGVARLSLFVVRPAALPAEGASEAARLRALADLFRKEPIVQAAVQNVQLGGVTAAAPGAGPVPPVADALIRSRFPQTWDLLRQRGITGAIEVGVLDIGFLPDQPDLRVTRIGPGSNPTEPHGTQVASIIAARNGNGVGVDGAAPSARIVAACSTGALFDEFVSLLELLLARRPRLRVINASVAYNWATIGVVPSRSSSTRTIVAENGIMVRKAMRGAPDTVLVSAAGNDCARKASCMEPAMWASPYNWAALAPGSVLEGAPSENVFVVEGLDRTGAARLTMSNIGGTIKAIGQGVPSLGPGGTVLVEDGTSASAPLVTATVAMMLQVNRRLSVSDIRQNLGIGGPTVPALDALAAVQRSLP